MITETEISLIMYSENIEIVFNKIKGMQNIYDFKLEHNMDERIIDTYFDDILHSLHKKKFALRTRNKNNVDFITLKGPPKYEFQSVSRSENEYKWSEEAFDTITKQLAELTEINGKEIDKYFDKNPIKTLQQLGFREIHTHNNNRKVINITKKNDVKNDVIAEMDIDNVTFPLKSNSKLFNVSVINVEIEKKGKINQDDIIRIITSHLKQEFGTDAVREWKYGKLALGMGIEKLYKENELKKYISSNGYLKCDVLDKIKKFVDKSII